MTCVVVDRIGRPVRVEARDHAGTHHLYLHVDGPGGAVPLPGLGTPASRMLGSQGFTTILGWVAWVAFGICVLGVIITGAQMAISHRGGGGGGEHAARLGWVFAGCIVIGSASALVGALA